MSSLNDVLSNEISFIYLTVCLFLSALRRTTERSKTLY